jgi:hypothetical protein
MHLVAVNVALPFGSAQVYNIITMCYLSGSILDCLSVAHLGVFGKIKQFSTLGHCSSIEGLPSTYNTLDLRSSKRTR